MSGGDLRALAADLAGAGQKVRTEASAVVRKSGLAVQNGARSRATVDTGFMRSSIQMTAGGGGLTATIDAGAYYAVFQEFGTSRGVPAVRFMSGALEAVEPSFVAAMEQVGVNIL